MNFGALLDKNYRTFTEGDFSITWIREEAMLLVVNILRTLQNGRRFVGDIFKDIFVNGNVLISIKISVNFVSTVSINNIPALVQIMAWRRSGEKPLSEPRIDC